MSKEHHPASRDNRGEPLENDGSPSTAGSRRPRRLGVLPLSLLTAIVAIAVSLGVPSVADHDGAEADGSGSPVTCESTYASQSGNSVDAGTGNVITGICILGGDASGAFTAPASPANDCDNFDADGRSGTSLHSTCLTGDDAAVNALVPSCYTVTGMQTQTVTVSTTGDCTVEHIDYLTEASEDAYEGTKSHLPAFDTVDAGTLVLWTVVLSAVNTEPITFTDTVPTGFELDTQSFSNDAGVPCTVDQTTETLTCSGTATQANVTISIRAAATACGSEFVNEASGTVDGSPFTATDPVTVVVENCPGAAPFLSLQVKDAPCVDGSFTDATSLEPGGMYCLWISAGNYVITDSWTLSETGANNELFQFFACGTNSAGSRGCELPDTPGPSPHTKEFTPPQDDDSFVFAEVDFTLDGCDPNVQFTLMYDGPTLMTNSTGLELPCTQPGGLRVTKVCDPVGAVGSFDMQLLDDGGSPIGSPVSVDCGASHLFAPLTPGTYSVDEVGGTPDFTETTSTCDGVTVNSGRPATECSITNVMDAPPAGEFAKYTDPEDEVLSPGEVFDWYIDVPAGSGFWVLSDTLPHGFRIQGAVQPGATCWEWLSRYFTCIGYAADPATTVIVTVKAPSACGEYTNTAKLTSTVAGFLFASDTVSVEGCEESGGGGGGGSSSPWWWQWIR